MLKDTSRGSALLLEKESIHKKGEAGEDMVPLAEIYRNKYSTSK
jgi:hypothetical protein